MRDKLFNDLSAALDAVPAAFVLYDADEKLVICNNAYREEYAPFQHLIKHGVSHTDLQWLKIREGLDKNSIGRAEQFIADEQDRHRNGPEMEEWQDDQGKTIRLLRARLPNGHVVGVRFDVSDLRNAQRALEVQNEELKQARKSLSEQANRDDLTGLLNRRAMRTKVARLAEAGKETAMVILQLDLDGFKRVNDNAGHAAGDFVLMQTAERLKEILPESSLLARIGGDEFQIILAEQSESEAEALGNRIVEALAMPFEYKGRTFEIGASLGIARSFGTNPETGFEDLVRRADIALYHSKEHGRGKTTVFSKEIARKRRSEDVICAEIDNGSLLETFEILMQPRVRAKDAHVALLEAVPQWNHTKLGRLDLSDIRSAVKRAHKGDQIDGYQIDIAILKKVFAYIAQWKDRGWQVPPVSLGVSGRFLSNPHLLETLKVAEAPQHALSFSMQTPTARELASSTLLWNTDGLHELGIDIHLEGVGAQTTLGTLLTLKPRQLVLDTAVTRAAPEEEQARQTVGMAVALGTSIGAEMVAKGVEDKHHATLMAKLNCTLVQGPQIALPFPAEGYDGAAFAASKTASRSG